MSYSLLVSERPFVNPQVDPAMERYRIIESYLEGARTLASVATEAEITLRTAQRWVERYRRDGLASLVRRQRVDQGSRRVISDRMLEMIEVSRWRGHEYRSLQSIES